LDKGRFLVYGNQKDWFLFPVFYKNEHIFILGFQSQKFELDPESAPIKNWVSACQEQISNYYILQEKQKELLIENRSQKEEIQKQHIFSELLQKVPFSGEREKILTFVELVKSNYHIEKLLLNYKDFSNNWKKLGDSIPPDAFSYFNRFASPGNLTGKEFSDINLETGANGVKYLTYLYSDRTRMSIHCILSKHSNISSKNEELQILFNCLAKSLESRCILDKDDVWSEVLHCSGL
ncbi:hypothetical protein ACFL35_13180, partial [Candidatus Riflebacteria bacterium]